MVMTKAMPKKTIGEFGTLTPKMNRYREEILNAKPYVDPERAVLTTEAYKKYQDQQVDIIRARVLEHILHNMTIFIEKDTLLVGNQAQHNRWPLSFLNIQ